MSTGMSALCEIQFYVTHPTRARRFFFFLITTESINVCTDDVTREFKPMFTRNAVIKK